MLIQDIYAVGMRIHQLLLNKGLHTKVRTPEAFKEMWESAVTQVAGEIATGNLKLIGDYSDIDWRMVFEETDFGGAG